MNKFFYGLSGYMLILLLAISVGFTQEIKGVEEQSAEKASGNDQPASKEPESMSVMFKGTVVEVIKSSRHVYLHIDTGEMQIWVTAPTFDGKPGDTVFIPPGVPIDDFYSKKLNRRFERIYFVGDIRRIDVRSEGQQLQPLPNDPPHNNPKVDK